MLCGYVRSLQGNERECDYRTREVGGCIWLLVGDVAAKQAKATCSINSVIKGGVFFFEALFLTFSITFVQSLC